MALHETSYQMPDNNGMFMNFLHIHQIGSTFYQWPETGMQLCYHMLYDTNFGVPSNLLGNEIILITNQIWVNIRDPNKVEM